MSGSFFNQIDNCDSLEKMLAILNKIEEGMKQGLEVKYIGINQNPLGCPVLVVADSEFPGSGMRVRLSELVKFAYDAGNGILLFNGKDKASEVEFGRLWSYFTEGKFFIYPSVGADYKPDFSKMTIRNPTDQELPHEARKSLEAFHQAVAGNHKLDFAVVEDRLVNPPLRSIVLNLFREHFETEEKFTAYGKVLRWMMPVHYSVHILSNSHPMAKHFQPIILH